MIENSMIKLETSEYTHYDLFKALDGICERAKNLILNFIFRHHAVQDSDVGSLIDVIGDIFTKFNVANLSPAEQIFTVAFCIHYAWYTKDRDSFTMSSIEWAFDCQHVIKYKDKKYIADFVIDFNLINEEDGGRFFEQNPQFKNLKYVIEIDGHEYHSKKHQMAADYERENNLKELGYSVIRFTGSQVYNNPLSCVDKMISIIVNDIDKDGEQDG